jgi:hypothetical protein
MLGHRRLKIDSLKWVLSRMNPKKFGDKVQQEHTINDITEIRLTDATTDINT